MPSLDRTDCALVVVDLQQKLVPTVEGPEALVENTSKLIRAARVLEVPVLVTEQYPKGIGPTVDTLSEHLDGAPVIEKLAFSVWGEPDFRDRLNALNVNQVIVTGIETHVCVVQSVVDLLRHGYRVFVAADACSCRRQLDGRLALERMQQAGAVITTVESAIFELTGVAGTPLFKSILGIVK